MAPRPLDPPADPSGLPGLADAPAAETPHYHGHRERLRARFAEHGAEALPDYELLELALFRASPGGT